MEVEYRIPSYIVNPDKRRKQQWVEKYNGIEQCLIYEFIPYYR
jgi:hypothetical protein